MKKRILLFSLVFVIITILLMAGAGYLFSQFMDCDCSDPFCINMVYMDCDAFCARQPLFNNQPVFCYSVRTWAADCEGRMCNSNYFKLTCINKQSAYLRSYCREFCPDDCKDNNYGPTLP